MKTVLNWIWQISSVAPFSSEIWSSMGKLLPERGEWARGGIRAGAAAGVSCKCLPTDLKAGISLAKLMTCWIMKVLRSAKWGSMEKTSGSTSSSRQSSCRDGVHVAGMAGCGGLCGRGVGT